MRDTPTVPEGRYHYMDAMRSVLMLLGIVLHTCLIFSTLPWLVKAAETSTFLERLGEVIHYFRMPAFFVVSGFFCALTLRKYGTGRFAELRFKRIVIPLVATALTFNVAQGYVLDAAAGQEFDLGSYLHSHHMVSHLWFLINLVVYFTVAVALASAFGRYLSSGLERLKPALAACPLPLLLFVLAGAIPALQALATVAPLYDRYLGVLIPYDLLEFAPYFVFGTVIFHDRELLDRFAHPPVVATIALLAVSAYLLWIHDSFLTGRMATLVSLQLTSFISWVSASLCFFLFARFFDQKSRVFRYLSDASYSVYLFHHLAVVCFGLLIVPLVASPILSFLCIVAAVTAVCFGLHAGVVERFRIVRFLFNGKFERVSRGYGIGQATQGAS